jgi:D-threo-aldose 1-dehydrogenase
MRTVGIGDTGLTTSRLGFGCASLHHHPGTRARQRLLECAFDEGVRHFDAAPYYGHMLAEHELGRFARARRASLTLATKFGIEPDPLLSRYPPLLYARLAAQTAVRRVLRRSWLTIVIRRDYGVANARRSIERSLRALMSDHIDLLLVHEPALLALPDGEALVVLLDELRAAGRIRSIGLAGHARDLLQIAERYPALADVVQIDAASDGGGPAAMAEAGRDFHISFGHFRGNARPIDAALATAARVNPRGIILFSTRRAERIGEMAAALARVEAA